MARREGVQLVVTLLRVTSRDYSEVKPEDKQLACDIIADVGLGVVLGWMTRLWGEKEGVFDLKNI